MSRRIQLGKRNLRKEESSGGGRKFRRLPPVVLKGYLSPKAESTSNGCREDGDEIGAGDTSPDSLKCSECEKCFERWLDLYQHCKEEHPKSGDSDVSPNEEDGINGQEEAGEANDVEEPGVEPASGNDVGQTDVGSPDDPMSKIRTTWCHICKKHLATVSSRNLHMRIHTGERPFVCPFCTKAFTQNVHLRSHMSVHTGAKPYVCEVCGKGFVAGRTLKIHMMSHTREIPHTCRWCGRKFLLRNHLLMHIQTHHGPDQSIKLTSPPSSSVSAVGKRSPSNGSTSSKKNSRMKYHLQPPQRVLVGNSSSDQDREKSIDQQDGKTEIGQREGSADQRASLDLEAQSSRYEWQLNSAIGIKVESPENVGDETEIGHRSSPPICNFSSTNNRSSSSSKMQRPTLSRFVNASTSSNSRKSKNRVSREMGKSAVTNLTTTSADSNHNPCPNCSIVDSELQLLKTELGLIKQFLGSKLTLMEQKIDNIRVLIK